MCRSFGQACDTAVRCKRATRMRNLLLAATAAIVLCGAGMGGALAQHSDDGKFRWMKVKNESPFTAYQIYIVPSQRPCCWSRDLLEVLEISPKRKESGKPSGRTSTSDLYVNFDDGSGNCVFDILITTREYIGWDWFRTGVNVCDRKGQEGVITLKGERVITLNEIPDATKVPRPSVKIRNASSALIANNVYMIKKDKDCCWSPDLLGDRFIWRGGHSLVVPFDDGSGRCKDGEIRKYDIRVTSDKKGIDWYFDGVDVCKVEDITLRGEKKDAKNRLMVKNDTDFEAFSAHIVRDGKKSDDLLKEHVIRAKEHLEVDFYDGRDGCIFDVVITRRDRGRGWDFKDFNVCQQSELILNPPQAQP